MPVWAVSQPYLNLWLEDEPFGYQPALGPRISLRLNYNQSEHKAGKDGALFSLGEQWTSSWLSYVTLGEAANEGV